MERYNGILCVSAGELIEGGFISKPNLDYHVQKKNIKRVRRACKETPALLDVYSLPSKILQRVKESNGGNLEKAADTHSITSHYVLDQQAYVFYRDHRFDDDKPLETKYIEEYSINASVLNTVRLLANERIEFVSSRGNRPTGLWQDMSCRVNACRKELGHTLPENYRRLKLKLEEYEKDGYGSLISGKFRNRNTEKITEEAKLWILSRWADRINKVTGITQMFREYNEKSRETGWSILKSELSIYNFLHKPEIKAIWFAHRYGDLVAKEKLCYQHTTKLPQMRDALWYSDGTKLNYYYRSYDSSGKFSIKTTSVYEVMDAYSEVFLGYHISDQENFEQQSAAYKMALEFAGCKPYQIKFDNQGGHKKQDSEGFLSKLAHLAIRTAPYNGKSKTIESAFGRFQQQYLKQDCFFTGQNVTTKTIESRSNKDFIMANLDKLPTLEEIKDVYKKRREEWNNAPHPSIEGKTRMEVYLESANPQTKKIELMDIIEIFWTEREKQVTCTASGISFKENKIKYEYMVLKSGLPDLDWLENNIDNKFTVKYDPDNMDTIALYRNTPNGVAFEALADSKTVIHRATQEQEDWEAKFIKNVELANKAKRVERSARMDDILQMHGALPEQQGYTSTDINGRAKRSAKVHLSDPNKVTSNQIEPNEDFDPISYAYKNQ